MSKHLPARRPASDNRYLWRRAAEMDLEAERNGGTGTPNPLAPSQHLSTAELLEVGREAGISPDSVLLSVAESRLADADELRPRGESPLWHRLLTEVRDALEVSVTLPLPPADAVQVVDEVMARREFRLSLEDRVGEGPDGETVSIYRNAGGEGALSGSGFHGALMLSDGRVLLVAVLPAEEGGSRVRIRMPLYERTTNLALSGVSAGTAGAGGLAGGAALGEALVGAILAGSTGILPLALVVTPAVAGAYLGAGAGVLAFRKLQGWGFGKGRVALNRLARVLEVAAGEGRGGPRALEG